MCGESTGIIVVHHVPFDELAFTHGRITENDNFQIRLHQILLTGIDGIVGIIVVRSMAMAKVLPTEAFIFMVVMVFPLSIACRSPHHRFWSARVVRGPSSDV
jgi:hypothetical protein